MFRLFCVRLFVALCEYMKRIVLSSLTYLFSISISLASGNVITHESPLCGVLTTSGYIYSESNLVFLIPASINAPTVKRYSVEAGSPAMPPIEVLQNWWVCVTNGKIITEPNSETPDFYGVIQIEEISIEQSNGERGQE